MRISSDERDAGFTPNPADYWRSLMDRVQRGEITLKEANDLYQDYIRDLTPGAGEPIVVAPLTPPAGGGLVPEPTMLLSTLAPGTLTGGTLESLFTVLTPGAPLPSLPPPGGAGLRPDPKDPSGEPIVGLSTGVKGFGRGPNILTGSPGRGPWFVPLITWEDNGGGEPACCIVDVEYPSTAAEKRGRAADATATDGSTVKGKKVGFEFDAFAIFDNSQPCVCKCCEAYQYVRRRVQFVERRDDIAKHLQLDFDQAKMPESSASPEEQAPFADKNLKVIPSLDSIEHVGTVLEATGLSPKELKQALDIEATAHDDVVQVGYGTRTSGTLDAGESLKTSAVGGSGYRTPPDFEKYLTQLKHWKENGEKGDKPTIPGGGKRDNANGCVFNMRDFPGVVVYEKQVVVAEYQFRLQIRAKECTGETRTEEFRVRWQADYSGDELEVTYQLLGPIAKFKNNFTIGKVSKPRPKMDKEAWRKKIEADLGRKIPR